MVVDRDVTRCVVVGVATGCVTDITSSTFHEPGIVVLHSYHLT